MRDVGEAQIASSMQAAYRVYAKGEDDGRSGRSRRNSIRNNSPAGWNTSKTTSAQNSRSGMAATDANRKEIAAQYQEDFHRSAYQYDQDLSWWKEARAASPTRARSPVRGRQ